jgi:hypothetical protein
MFRAGSCHADWASLNPRPKGYPGLVGLPSQMLAGTSTVPRNSARAVRIRLERRTCSRLLVVSSTSNFQRELTAGVLNRDSLH